MKTTKNGVVKEIAGGFESYISFFSGLRPEDERRSTDLYEKYLRAYIKHELSALLERVAVSVEEAKEEDKMDNDHHEIFHANVALQKAAEIIRSYIQV